MNRIRPILLAMVTTGLLLALPSGASALGQADLDASFGSGGVLATGENLSSSDTSLVTQADGKILLGLNDSAGSARIRRYNPDGTPDATFGANGLVTLPGPNGSVDANVSRIVLDPDGTIYATGGAMLAGVERIAVWALAANGALKASFNSAGTPAGTLLLPVVGDSENSFRDAAYLPSGDVLLVSDGTAAGVSMIVLRSVHPDGSAGFSTTQGIPGMQVNPHAVAVAADGRFAVAASVVGPLGLTSALFGSTPAGNADAGFGTGGGVQGLAQLPGLYADVARMHFVDGKYLAIGNLSYTNMFLRNAANGAPDATFGSGGVARSISTGAVYSVLYDGIPVAGGAAVGVGIAFAAGSVQTVQVVRVGPDGRPDGSFAPSGSATLAAPGVSPYAAAITRQLDGKYVIATSNDSGDLSLLRIWGDHPAPQPATASFSAKLRSKTRAKKLRKISGASAGTGVSRIDVAIQQVDSRLLKKSGRCRYLKSTRGKISRPRAVGGRCVPNVWMRARGNVRWSLNLRKALKPGKYVLSVRATGMLGVGAVTTKSITLTK